MPKRPLEGVKVADFTWSVVGPLTARILADYGAEVVKIEGRSKPDMMRVIQGAFKDGIPGLDRAGSFLPYNTGKLSVALNLTHPVGVEIAKRFVAWADIVVETFAGGAMKRMGLGYEELKKIKPDIIMLSSCTMGQEGPYSTLPSLGPHLVAMSGLTNITGWPDRDPSDMEVYTDFISSHFNLVAILSALNYRRRTGKGQYLDLSQYENAVHFMAPAILEKVVNKREVNRMGNQLPCAAPHGAYRCCGEDRWCAIAVFTDAEWQSFCQVIGNPAWSRDPKFATLLGRKDNEEQLDKLVEEWTINYSPEEVTTMMQKAGVPAGTIQTTEDMLDHDPHLKDRHFYWELEHPVMGRHRVWRSPFTLSKSPCELRRAPLLGEHNEYALKQILGMSDEEIADLIIKGVIE
jgi:benzylsuccinate CoA-transferase BbsF subunit